MRRRKHIKPSNRSIKPLPQGGRGPILIGVQLARA
jgi:hypothetical protein